MKTLTWIPIVGLLTTGTRITQLPEKNSTLWVSFQILMLYSTIGYFYFKYLF